ncbi:ATP-binding protein [Streptomyces sp. MMS24-I2-30]|uniref:ATP-binding protein n=1 Tax=Streptomyces sp. MMS24-I2-30 TaxID=3351564 RepID=UPI0038969733
MEVTTYWFRHSAEPLAVPRGRAFVSRCLDDFGLAHLCEDAKMIASELLTNALKATGTQNPKPTARMRETLPLIAVRVRVSGPVIHIQVWDTSTELPKPEIPQDDAETGRGLPLVVAALSLRWDAYRDPSGGKIVSAQLAIARPPVTRAAQEPGSGSQPAAAEAVPGALARHVGTAERAPLRMVADVPVLAQLERLLEEAVSQPILERMGRTVFPPG